MSSKNHTDNDRSGERAKIRGGTSLVNPRGVRKFDEKKRSINRSSSMKSSMANKRTPSGPFDVKRDPKRGMIKRTQSLHGMQMKRGTISRVPSGIARQSKVIKDSASIIACDVKSLTKGADFLASQGDAYVALFDRSEIDTGVLLGEGSFSQVFEVKSVTLANNQNYTKDEAFERDRVKAMITNNHEPGYAIKYLNQKLLRKPKTFVSAAADLVVEGMYLAKLNHPNIIRLRGLSCAGLEAFKDGHIDSYFLLTDRLTDTLDNKIKDWQAEGAPDDRLIGIKTRYAMQIADALTYLHERRILFRDLKPPNVGLKNEKTVQLFDFGLCRELPPPKDGVFDEVFMMSGAGTRRYMAPEIFNDRCYNDKVDVYSLSMVYYEMLAQNKPYAKFTRDDHQHYVCEKGERPSISRLELPRPIQQILLRSWTQKISQRYTAIEMREALFDVLQDLGEAFDEEDMIGQGGEAIVDWKGHGEEDDVSASLEAMMALETDSHGTGELFMESRSDVTMMSLGSASNASGRIGRGISHFRLWVKNKTSKGDEEKKDGSKRQTGIDP